jgi:hypothetical protein
MKAAICSRVTLAPGLKVVADVPLVRPEKKTAATEQKKGFDEGTSVNGKVKVPPAQLPVSAFIRPDSAVRPAIKESSKTKRRAYDFLLFMSGFHL